MSKFAVTVSAAVILAGSVPGSGTPAPRWVGLTRQSKNDRPISRVLPAESSPDSVLLRIVLPGFFLDEQEMADGRTYAVINVPGAGSHRVGYPDLPVFGETILVPNGTVPVIEVEPGEALVYEGMDISPLQPPPTDGGRPPFTKDPDVYARDDDFPAGFASLEPVARIRGRETAILWIYPYRYNPARGLLSVYPDLRVTVRFAGSRRPSPARLNSHSFDRLLGRVAVNADAVLAAAAEEDTARPSARGKSAARGSGSAGSCDYLIVTHSDFSEAAAVLAAWKRKAGFPTHVATTAETGGTAAEIIAYLQDAYDTWDPAPAYVLFIGDAEFLPTNYRTTHPYSGATIGTDLYYATLDGSDYFPDIITGRISVDTAEQAMKRVNDIIGYETDPVTEESFYATAAICTLFQHYADGYAERRFAQTSEDLAVYLSDPDYLGEYSVERFYYTGADVTPLYWSVFYFSGGPAGGAGDPIPAYLKKPGFPWDASAADISAAVNAGRFLVTHRDHGSATSWGSPYYSTAHVSALANGEKLPVVWSVNCSTGFFDKETCDSPSSTVSFSETWERNPLGGAAGIIAATRVSYSGHNDRLFWGWIDAVWPEFVAGFSGPETSYLRMGDVLNYGKFYYATTYAESIYRKVEFEIFHWFGDPAMMIRTRVPETLSVFHPALVFQGVPVDFEVAVECGGSPLEGATVTLYREDVPGDYRTSTTDGTGTAIFAGLAASETGEYELVVTAPETVPYQGTFSSLDAPTPSPAPSPSPTAVTWPGSGDSEVGYGLPAGFEPSGVVWHERLGVLFVVGDGGHVARMDEYGAGVTIWSPGGDLEGIAVVDPATDYLYLGVEDPDSIREFDFAAGALTGRSWALTDWMTGAANSGLEALTFVPDGHHPYSASSSGGLFYAGLQADGKIYVFDVDLSPGGGVAHVDTIVPVSGRSDLSGLHYHRENRTLYAVFDGSNRLREMEADGTLIAEYPLPGNDQEGVTLKPSCPSPVTSLFIAEDVGPEVWRYDGYPVNCVAATPVPTTTPPPQPVVWASWEGLVGRWSFDEGSGLTARDAAGENDGTFLGMGEEAWDAEGRFGGCVSFSGVSGERVDCGSAAALDLQAEGTVVAWVYNRTLTAYRGYLGRYPDWLTGGWYLTPVNGGKLKLVAWDAEGDYNTCESSVLETGRWQFVAWRWEDGVATVFIDGTSFSAPAAGAAIRSCPGGSLEIGRHTSGGISFDGKIDEVGVFNRALSDSEIAQIRDNATPVPTP